MPATRKKKTTTHKKTTTVKPSYGHTVVAIEGVDVQEYTVPELRLEWTANMAIDCDGSGGNPDNDPYYQPDTSLHYNGKALNAYEVPFIVVPPAVINCVKPVVLGCMAVVVNLKNGMATQAVVGDVGPSSKIGEASCYCAELVGLDGNPNHGGCDENCIRYMIFPGEAAEVDGVTYKLQPS
jgi:hypothetical protein